PPSDWVCASILAKHSLLNADKSLRSNPCGAFRTSRFRSAARWICTAVAVLPRAESRMSCASAMNRSKLKKDVIGAHALVFLFTISELATIQLGCVSVDTGPHSDDSGCISSRNLEMADHAAIGNQSRRGCQSWLSCV